MSGQLSKLFFLNKNLYWQFKAIYITLNKNLFPVLYVPVFPDYAWLYKTAHGLQLIIKQFLFYFSTNLLGSNLFAFNNNQINTSNQNLTLEDF